MKQINKSAFLLMAFLLLTVSGIAQRTFEGNIVYTIELMGESADQMAAFMPQSYEYLVKGKKIKFKMNGGMTAMMMGEIIVDGETEKAWMVKHEEQMVYTFPENDIEEEQSTPSITKEDEVIAISGYECQKYKVVTEGENGASSTQYLWVTDKIKFERSAKAKELNTGTFFLDGIEGVPLKIMIENTGMTMIMTATTVDKKKVSDSEFEIPGSYEQKEFDPAKPLGGN